MSQNPKAENQLREGARLVVQERTMLVEAFAHYVMLETREADATSAGERNRLQIEKNMALESFMLHFRNLVEFLKRKRLDKMDVKAWDYVPGRKVESAPDERFDEISARLSHLSYKRLAVHDSEKAWNIAALLQDFEKSWQEFIDLLRAYEDGYRVAWFCTASETLADPPKTVKFSTTPSVAASTSEVHSTVSYLFPSE